MNENLDLIIALIATMILMYYILKEDDEE